MHTPQNIALRSLLLFAHGADAQPAHIIVAAIRFKHVIEITQANWTVITVLIRFEIIERNLIHVFEISFVKRGVDADSIMLRLAVGS